MTGAFFFVLRFWNCRWYDMQPNRYGVPGKHAKGFERCLAKVLGETLESVSEHLYRITKMLSPVYLQAANVRERSGGRETDRDQQTEGGGGG